MPTIRDTVERLNETTKHLVEINVGPHETRRRKTNNLESPDISFEGS